MSHRDRILEALREHGALDDDALARLCQISPRQTVNQICRRLETLGVLRRHPGDASKIVNELAASVPAPSDSNLSDEGKLKTSQGLSSVAAPEWHLSSPITKTLLIIPCSGAKIQGGHGLEVSGGIVQHLPEPLASRLLVARQRMRSVSFTNESELLPAAERYAGSFYKAAGASIRDCINAGGHIIIISGGYGLLTPDEPVGVYDAVFKRQDWPPGLLESALAIYAQEHRIAHVRAFLAASTSYRKVVEQVCWTSAGLKDALLISPSVEGGGAMLKTPRTLGEAFSDFTRGRLDSSWSSSDGTKIVVRPIKQNWREVALACR
jgi:hypothetical protein